MKERIKRLFASIAAILMAIAMIGANAVPVMAADNNDGTITINNPVANEHYDVYKVFDAVPDNAENPHNVAYTYTKNEDTDAFLNALLSDQSPFTVTKVGNTNQYDVVWKAVQGQTDAQKATALTTFLNAQKHNLGAAVRSIKPVTSAGVTADSGYTNTVITAANGETPAHIVLRDLDYGYYYITTTTGSAVLINNAAKNVTIGEKNTVPSIDKKQGLKNGDNVTYSDDPVHVNIGDNIYYQIQVTVGANNNGNYNISDTLSDGLSLNVIPAEGEAHETIDGGTIKVGDTPMPVTNYKWSLVPDQFNRIQGFKLVIDGDYLNTLPVRTVITIQYSAKLNSNAVIDHVTNQNINTATLQYSHQTTTDSTVAYTYDFQLKKVDSSDANTFIPGAEFKLYNAAAGGTQIVVAKDNKGYYVDKSATANANTTVISVDTSTGVNVRGLAPGEYWLEETKAPAGYNQMTSRQKLTIVANDNNAVDVTVQNSKGSLLPSTGGIGTTIFYIVGGVLIIGAAVLLIARRKRNA